MKFTGYIIVFYGLIVLLGGLQGYLEADSLPSLIAGTISGALLFASGLGVIRKSIIAYFTSLGVTILLTIIFCIRYYQTLSAYPAGSMAGLSFLVLLLILTSKGRPSKQKAPKTEM